MMLLIKRCTKQKKNTFEMLQSIPALRRFHIKTGNFLVSVTWHRSSRTLPPPPTFVFSHEKLRDVIQDQFFMSLRIRGDVRISLMKRLGLKCLFEIRIIKHGAALNGTISPTIPLHQPPQYENSEMVNIFHFFIPEQ